ncbi:4'-phosphopantetheinyl transferase [enterobactin] siderophore [Klebsiella pneumoniae IS53]|nr:4'-phosphopantetheinyl transferase [enterobactin] siderophore [Klebsiella pneumoniae IS53]
MWHSLRSRSIYVFTASFSLQLADFPLKINHLIKDDLVITCTCPTREA